MKYFNFLKKKKNIVFKNENDIISLLINDERFCVEIFREILESIFKNIDSTNILDIKDEIYKNSIELDNNITIRIFLISNVYLGHFIGSLNFYIYKQGWLLIKDIGECSILNEDIFKFIKKFNNLKNLKKL